MIDPPIPLHPCKCGCVWETNDPDEDGIGIMQTAGLVQVLCTGCGIEGPYGDNAQEASERWNSMWENPLDAVIKAAYKDLIELAAKSLSYSYDREGEVTDDRFRILAIKMRVLADKMITDACAVKKNG